MAPESSPMPDPQWDRGELLDGHCSGSGLARATQQADKRSGKTTTESSEQTGNRA